MLNFVVLHILLIYMVPHGHPVTISVTTFYSIAFELLYVCYIYVLLIYVLSASIMQIFS